ncbi:MAG: Abi-alpha family protein [Terracidiphilus sp.]|jgi:hypothetical protein
MNNAVEIVKSSAFDKLADIIHKLAGPMAEELGFMMGDKVRAYRVSNWVNVVRKTEKILAEANLPPKAVPPRMFIPILEASSIENDETLQDLWAGLLASASEEADSLSPSFIETLKQLTPGEAVTLESLYDYSQSIADTAHGMPDLINWFSLSPSIEANRLAVESFIRIGIIWRHYDLQSGYEIFHQSNGLSGQTGFEAYAGEPLRIGIGDLPILTYGLEFTEYGIRFMQACQGPKNYKKESESVQDAIV